MKLIAKLYVQELHLHGNSIGDEGIRALMSGLSSRKGKLAVLDIGNNSISAKGAFHVAEYIKNCKSLLWINLYMNDIGDEVFLFSIFSHACKFFKFSNCGL